MSEKQETVHVVMRRNSGLFDEFPKPVKVFDDRTNARSYAASHNLRSRRYKYTVVPVKKG